MRYRLALLSILLMLPGCGARASIAPAKDTLYTSTRYVRSIAAAPDGSIWVATMGGVLRRAPDGAWTKFTQLDGLPSNEAISVAIVGDKVKVTFPTADAEFGDGKWTSRAAKHDSYARFPSIPVEFHGKTYRQNGWDVEVRESGRWRGISDIGCVSQPFVKGDQLWVATYNGIWAFDGKVWKRANIVMPDDARDTTAMAMVSSIVWVGTREHGIWEYDGKSWKQHLQPDEPFSGECVSLAMYRGELYVATLNNGLMTRSTDGWQIVSIPGDALSHWPKSMMEFDGSLYVLQGNGTVDRIDGTNWEANIFPSIVRTQMSALAHDEGRIYAGQWGGWSEFDGKTWSHRLRNPSMQGRQVTWLLPDGDTLWVGLQGLGLAQVDESTGDITWHDERNGLADDWVTCARKIGDTVYAGTFYHGLASWDGKKWTVVPGLEKQRVNDIASDGKGGVLVAAASGVWRFVGGELKQLFTDPNSPDREANCLCVTDDGLWIGTRTGIFFAAKKP